MVATHYNREGDKAINTWDHVELSTHSNQAEAESSANAALSWLVEYDD